MKPDAILRIEPGNSLRLSLFLCSTHLGALSVIPLVPMAPAPQLGISLLIAISLVHALRTHVLRANGYAIKSAEWDGENEWILFMADGKTAPARLKSSSYVQPWLVILNFSLGRFSTRTLILLPDAVDPELLRRLRLRLRLISWRKEGGHGNRWGRRP